MPAPDAVSNGLIAEFVAEDGEVPEFALASKVVYKAGKQDFFCPGNLNKSDMAYAEACAHNRAFAERIGLKEEEIKCFNIIRFINNKRILFSVVVPPEITKRFKTEPIQIVSECPWLVHDETKRLLCHALP